MTRKLLVSISMIFAAVLLDSRQAMATDEADDVNLDLEMMLFPDFYNGYTELTDIELDSSPDSLDSYKVYCLGHNDATNRDLFRIGQVKHWNGFAWEALDELGCCLLYDGNVTLVRYDKDDISYWDVRGYAGDDVLYADFADYGCTTNYKVSSWPSAWTTPFISADGGAGDDSLEGGPGGDMLSGGSGGNDELIGWEGPDYLYGYGGADNLYGVDDYDYLYGGDDNCDYLDGGSDGDHCDCGAGSYDYRTNCTYPEMGSNCEGWYGASCDNY